MVQLMKSEEEEDVRTEPAGGRIPSLENGSISPQGDADIVVQNGDFKSYSAKDSLKASGEVWRLVSGLDGLQSFGVS
jgi:hypothetical protein